MNKKQMKKFKKFGDDEAAFAFRYMGDGNSKLELAVYMEITVERLELIESLSEKFKESVERGYEAGLAYDIKKLKKDAFGKFSKPADKKLYFGIQHNLDDKAKIDESTGGFEEFGFDIKVRKK